MISTMYTCTHTFKIFNGIVQSITVFMMDMMSFRNFSFFFYPYGAMQILFTPSIRTLVIGTAQIKLAFLKEDHAPL